jgi:hypothetical protein
MDITRTQQPPHTLPKKDFPVILRSADVSAIGHKRRYRSGVRIELFMLIAAAVAGLFVMKTHSIANPIEWAGVVAAAAFFASFIFQADRLIQKPDRAWYKERAIVESTKTLTWRYAVGGNPFTIVKDDANHERKVDASFITRIRGILSDVNQGAVVIPRRRSRYQQDEEQITQGMRALRAQPLEVRREIYETGRIKDQYEWYTSKAQSSQQAANIWGGLLILAEIAGMVIAILEAIGVINIDLLGLAGTVAAAAVSWLQLGQFQDLAQAYAIAAQELLTIKANIADQQTEEEWANFVDQAEGAISREHTLWRSAHSVSLKDE